MCCALGVYQMWMCCSKDVNQHIGDTTINAAQSVVVSQMLR